jgi:dihydroorotate dehydrogenase
MPDWSYQTVFRPVLFRLAPALARDLALGAMGRLSRLPFGPTIIRFFGHTTVDGQLRQEINGVSFPTSVGLGCGIDANLIAPKAIAQLGVGFIEVGPVTIAATGSDGDISRDDVSESIVLANGDLNPGLDHIADKLRAVDHLSVPIVTRVGRSVLQSETADAEAIVNRMAQFSQVIAIPCAPFTAEPTEQLSSSASSTVQRVADITRLAKQAGFKIVLLTVAVDHSVDDAHIQSLLESSDVDGVLMDGASFQNHEFRQLGRQALEPSIASIKQWKNKLPTDKTIVASGGVHEPADALAFARAGADLIQIDSGFVFAGPGLAKRINDVTFNSGVENSAEESGAASEIDPTRIGGQSWFWALLLGLSMTFGGVLALLIAITRVLLPYDEATSGMSLAELCAINGDLLSFMQHDRVTLAGTMLADGILYSCFAWFGIRRGKHWAGLAIAASAFVGFFSFFLFLGFGYFDPFHAFVTAVLLQLLLLMVHSKRSPRQLNHVLDLHNDAAWKRHQWGQLLFVIQGFAIITGGIVICFMGSTSVFVQEDLDFMNTTAAYLQNANPRLVPLIAHDRASFGGMLISCGLAVLLLTLWGFKRGERWLWNAVMCAGTMAYGATIAVHWHVGYLSLKHLMPAYGGLASLWLGGLLSRSYLCERPKPMNLPGVSKST